MYRFFSPTQQKAYKKLNLLNFYFKKYNPICFGIQHRFT
ncbi:hypothetical protein SPC_4627 [Salmonella enterica subsp. enterica serovar Paratyphi C str. RKS4594]|uniref:Uncharacterized protein n=1 Tax=Salmonella paratyphi C (strain RKS4594) TaxID=476213 RepID=C0Q7F3_SALPC|nr:hypothetical protein SPC_4627 [Salmonella enterica subsp. enterica serovar Paratyphi C str. RKS4594]